MNNSALRAMDILLLVAENPLTVSQISAALQIPKSSAHDILCAMTKRGFLQMDEQKRYAPGLSAYTVGMSYIGRTDLYSAGHAILQQLSRQLNHTVYLGIEDQGQVVYIDKAEHSSPIRFTRNPGDRNHLYRTGLGKAILAARPELLEGLSFPLERKTPTTLCTREELIKDLEDTRARGYALDMGEDNSLLRCVAVAVYDRDGKAIAAISCSMLAPEFDDPKSIALALTQASVQLSQALGYTK